MMTQSHHGIRRRDFLKGTAAAIGVPWIVSSSVFAKADKPAPSDRITLGFIGMGRMNLSHLNRYLGDNETHVLAVCDVDTTRREYAQQRVEERYGDQAKNGEYKGCAAYNDFQELIDRQDIDAVVISTPDHWHGIPVIEACKAKKDIYCEKPLSLTIHEAKQMIDAVEKHQRVLQTGSQQRSDREFWLACSLVRSGRIGDIKRVNINVGGPSHWCDLPAEDMEPGLDWDRWLGPAPKRPYNSVLSPRGVHEHFPDWRSYREYSGGMMTDWGAHHFDIAQWGLGMDDSGPVEIIPPEDDNAERGVRYLYDNGVEMVHGPGGGVQFIGTEGEITVNRGRLESDPESIIEEELSDDDVQLYRSTNHHRDWLECIRSRKQPICHVEIGARSVTVCHLGNLAYWYRKKLRWDPKNWKFIEPEEANEWLDVERREPFLLPSV